MIDDDELTRRLSDTLHARAERVTRPSEPFDPQRVGLTTFALTPVPARRRGAAVPVAAAAAVALVLAAVGVLTRSGDEPGELAATMQDPSAASGSVAPAAPEGLPAPTAAPPDGLALWGVAWGVARDETREPVSDDGWTQLFGVEGDPDARILVEYGVEEYGEAPPLDWTNPVATVRGQGAVVTEYGDGAFGHELLAWREGDRVRLAAFRGMTVDEAAAAIDTLRDRPGGAWGFDPPAGGPLILHGESETGPVATRAEFTYAAGVPANDGRRMASVVTTPATGGITRSYLHTWFAGERAGDGRVTSSIPQSGIVNVAWPDGRMAEGDAGGTDVPLAALERLVTSARPASAGQLADLWSEANDRLVSLPLVAGAEVGPGALELRGEGDRPRTLCLRLAAGTACTAPGHGLSGGGTISDAERATIVGLPVGEEWYVAVAAPDGMGVTFDPRDLPVAEVSAGGWRLSLAQPPNGVDGVDVELGNGTGRTVHRP